MYIDINKLECHVTPEGKGFLAYIDLGKDENGKRIRPKVRGRSEDEAVKKLEQKLRDMGYVQPKADTPKLDVIINQFTLVPDFVREYRVNYLMSKVESGDIKSRTVENYIYALRPFEQFFQQAMASIRLSRRPPLSPPSTGDTTTTPCSSWLTATRFPPAASRTSRSPLTLTSVRSTPRSLSLRPTRTWPSWS